MRLSLSTFIIVMLLAPVTGLPRIALAGEADVLDVKITPQGERVYRFDVTVQHDDEGWKHYADRWDVVAPDGTVLGERVLVHPHTQDPFTRGLSGVNIPAGIAEVTIRANDSVHELGGKVMVVAVP